MMGKSKKIDEILDSLDNCAPVPAPDFLYTRLKARMGREISVVPARNFWLLKPAYAIAVVTAVLVLNAFILLSENKNPQQPTVDTDTFQSLAADYRLNDNNNLYDITEERQP